MTDEKLYENIKDKVMFNTGFSKNLWEMKENLMKLVVSDLSITVGIDKNAVFVGVDYSTCSLSTYVKKDATAVLNELLKEYAIISLNKIAYEAKKVFSK